MNSILGAVFLIGAIGFFMMAYELLSLKAVPNLCKGFVTTFLLGASATLFWSLDCFGIMPEREWVRQTCRVIFALCGIYAGLYACRIVKNGNH